MNMSNNSYVNVKPEIQGNQLTVAELIELLKLCPTDAIVFHEGCDCWGDADRVELNATENKVLIGRIND
jgi:hypothetical protein